ncbi:MAG: hypothetical protein CVU56_25100 [Deltaproteobacteria bacterium HGW-Deltaproteobacteria-14]|jgi:flagellar motor switch protein FliG|nr:MAG: hypothetical protein CVU56_25100 [Deltaproteobacteria bacterium HGW-Deltaproteobacteria-14]
MAAPHDTQVTLGGQTVAFGPVTGVGMRRAAIAILLLGDELARDLFRQFRPEDVKKLLAVANELKGVTEDDVLSVLEELVGELERGVPGISGHGHRIEQAAVSVFGADLIRAVSSKEVAGVAMQIHAAARDKPDLFAQTLGREHPQTIAIVLAMLPPDIAGKVLRSIPGDQKVDVVRRVAELRSISSSVLADVTESVGREFDPVDDRGPITIDGLEMAVKLLKTVGAGDERSILDGLAAVDDDMAETIKSRLFTFEDLTILHDREIQLLMREIDQRAIPLALKNASEALQEKMLGNVSKRAAQMLRDDMAALGPVTLQQIEEAQQQVVGQVLAMAAEGKINTRPENAA